MGRGIERMKLFQSDDDRADFVARMAVLARDGHWVVYAWALMPNHFHLVVRTGQRPLFQSMRKLLTGYVVKFNRRHERIGHLFQKGMGYAGAEVARLLRVTTSTVNRLALSAELPEFRQSVNMLWSLRVPHPGPSAPRVRTPRGIRPLVVEALGFVVYSEAYVAWSDTHGATHRAAVMRGARGGRVGRRGTSVSVALSELKPDRLTRGVETRSAAQTSPGWGA
jgi:hypothetical protein